MRCRIKTNVPSQSPGRRAHTPSMDRLCGRNHHTRNGRARHGQNQIWPRPPGQVDHSGHIPACIRSVLCGFDTATQHASQRCTKKVIQRISLDWSVIEMSYSTLHTSIRRGSSGAMLSPGLSRTTALCACVNACLPTNTSTTYEGKKKSHYSALARIDAATCSASLTDAYHVSELRAHAKG